jgi:hypothetical protein
MPSRAMPALTEYEQRKEKHDHDQRNDPEYFDPSRHRIFVWTVTACFQRSLSNSCAAIRQPSAPSRKQCFHLSNLSFLTCNDLAAQSPDFRILDLRLLAHQDCAGVMRDHRPEKLLISDA